MTDPAAGAADRTPANDRIVEATLGLIAQHGIGAITMRQVAESAGVARQTLYNHYPDIDSIVVAAMRRHNDESIAMLDAALAVVDQPEARLEQLVRHSVSIGAHAHHAPGLEGGLAPSARAAIASYDDAVDERIRAILDDGLRSGSFRSDLDPATDAVLIRHLLTGVTEQAGRSADLAQLATIGTRTVLAAVVAPDHV